MRRRTVRNGLRAILFSMLLILGVSFFHNQLSVLFGDGGGKLYSTLIFWGSAIGGYGVVLSTIGFLLSAKKDDSTVKLFPWFMMIVAIVSLFFYMMASSFENGFEERPQRVKPGESISI